MSSKKSIVLKKKLRRKIVFRFSDLFSANCKYLLAFKN